MMTVAISGLGRLPGLSCHRLDNSHALGRLTEPAVQYHQHHG